MEAPRHDPDCDWERAERTGRGLDQARICTCRSTATRATRGPQVTVGTTVGTTVARPSSVGMNMTAWAG